MFTAYQFQQEDVLFIYFSLRGRSLHEEFYYKQSDWRKNNPVSSHNGCITTLQGVRHVPESRYNLISLGALQGEGISFNFEGDLIEVSKEAHVKFQAELVGNMYMLQNLKVTVDGL